MRVHHVSSHYVFFEEFRAGKKSHIHVPEGDYRRGDRIHLTDLFTGLQAIRDILTVNREFMYIPDMVSLGLLGPEVSTLRQMSVTNERGQTSVIWVGDSRAFKVGRRLRLYDNMDEWRIDSLWTALTPKNVPEKARIDFVMEIV